MEIKSYAKINLGLDVIKKRPDGYHEVKMVMQTINLFDVINIEVYPSGYLKDGIKLNDNSNIKIICNKPFVPCDERNIVYKTAKRFLEYTNKNADITVKIQKNIPVGAGLAGGSSNAAAVFEGLNILLKTNLAQAELLKISSSVGADVPFCIMKGLALAEGIGEILTPIKSNLNLDILLVKPPFGVSTPTVYKNLVLDENTYHAKIDEILNAINNENVLKLCENLGNTLEDVTLKMHPEILKIKNKLISLGALNSLMSGSGPSVFAIFDDKEKLENSYKIMKQKFFDTYITSNV